MTKKEKSVSELIVYLDDDQEINLAIPENVFEEVFEELESAIRSGSMWWVGNWSDVVATFNGRRIENINCRRVIGLT